MEVITLNKFNNCYDKSVSDVTTQLGWWDDIKSGKYKDEVQYLRGLYTTDRNKYSKVKTELLPVVSYQFNFNKRLNNDNIIQSTNLMFLEVDGKSHPDFKIDMINKSMVYTYYRSLSNDGYHIIAKTNGVTKNNFKDAFSYVVNAIGLSDYYDKDAKKMIQPSIISYDPDLYINENPFIFQFSDSFVGEQASVSIKYNNGRKVAENASGDYKFIFSNIDEVTSSIEFGEATTYVDFNGVNVIECLCLPNTIKDGNRQNALLGYCNNLVILNPDATEMQVMNMMGRVNSVMCVNPVGRERIANIVKSVFKYKYDGGLKPKYTTRKIIFDHSIKKLYTKAEKFEIVNQILTEKRANDSIAKLSEIIDGWDISVNGKITQTKICKFYSISKTTVNKYWSEFEGVANEINSNYKEFKKLYK